jgi:N6-L-threonylcarbamoyladenine synthase
MNILAIETSCDETAAAVVANGTRILSNVVASSAAMHVKTGGIIPEQAARQQVKSIIPVLSEAISDIGIKKIDTIAVTIGPGLIGSLLVGIETAKTLAAIWQKPIIPVNHLVGHIYANFIYEENIEHRTKNTEQTANKTPRFPALCLLVSGGHTDLVLMKGHGKMRWIGGTRDDAAGEAFDKCARLLGLGYPGGPSIAAQAAKLQILNSKLQIKLPRPMMDEDNFEWSFSGLKTAVLREVENNSKLKSNQRWKEGLSFEIQEAICDVLVAKTLRAVEKFMPKSLLVAGGVAANIRLREKFRLEIENSKLKIDFRVPPVQLCTDNAAYIASCAYFNYSPLAYDKIDANPQLTITGQH